MGWKTVSLAEMAVQNKEWREGWNDNPKYKKTFSFCLT
jgi:hypothetical protein